MANGGRLGARNVPGVDGYSGVWSLREVADARRKGLWYRYVMEVMADSPIAYWRLGESSGTTASDAVGTKHGTYTGSVTLGVAGLVLNDPDTAVDFSGGYVSIPALGSALTSWSIEASSKFDINTGSRTILSNDSSGWNNDVLFGLDPEDSFTTDSRIALVHQDATNQVRTIVTDTEDAVAGNTYHIIVTSDASSLRLYINGGLKATTPKAGAALTFGNNAINIGRNPQNSRFMDGVIDDVAVYGAALSAARVEAHYNAWASGFV